MVVRIVDGITKERVYDDMLSGNFDMDRDSCMKSGLVSRTIEMMGVVMGRLPNSFSRVVDRCNGVLFVFIPVDSLSKSIWLP